MDFAHPMHATRSNCLRPDPLSCPLLSPPSYTSPIDSLTNAEWDHGVIAGRACRGRIATTPDPRSLWSIIASKSTFPPLGTSRVYSAARQLRVPAGGGLGIGGAPMPGGQWTGWSTVPEVGCL